MTSEPMKPRRGDEDDSWESLAENLFGIEFSRDQADDELISPEELFADEPDAAADTEASAGDLTRDDSTGEGRAGELAEEVDSPEESPVSKRGDDEEQYWDALREWAADVAEPGAAEPQWTPAKTKRKKRDRQAPAERSSPEAGLPAARDEDGEDSERDVEREEFVADSDFASGLLEGEPSPKRSRPARSADRREEAAGEEGGFARRSDEDEPAGPERSRGRRRRRGRRSRAGEPETARGARAADEPDDDFGPAADVPQEGFGPAEEEPARARQDDDETRGRRPRRPRRRRREPSAEQDDLAIQRTPEEQSDEEELLVDWSAEPIVDAPPDSGSEEDEDEEREAVGAYRSIPTWEDAIACLLNPAAPESRGGDREGRPSSGRESGRRRRRRR